MHPMKNDTIQQILSQHSPEEIIDALDPFINDTRKARIDGVLNARLNGIHLAIEAPSDINNALAALRTSEALGISTVHLIATEGHAKSVRTITQGAVYWLNVIYHDTLDDFLNVMREQDRVIAGGTVDARSSLHDISVAQPLCILIGNEQRGLSPQAQQACQTCYKIPMYGMSESMNLSVSAAISLYDTSTRLRENLNAQSDLNCAQQSKLKAHYYLNSVSVRLASGLLTK